MGSEARLPNERHFRKASTPTEPAAQAPSAFLRVTSERFSLSRRLYFPGLRAAQEVSGSSVLFVFWLCFGWAKFRRSQSLRKANGSREVSLPRNRLPEGGQHVPDQALQDSQLRDGAVLPRPRVPRHPREGDALVHRPVRQGGGRHRLAARDVARSREARPDREVGGTRRPRRGPGPQGLRAGPRLDRQPVQPHSGRRTVRVLDSARRRSTSRSSTRGRCGSSTTSSR